MIDPNHRPHDAEELESEDTGLRSLLGPLASLGPSGRLRGRTRRRVLAALEEQASAGARSRASVPWWRRQVRVPLPLAAAVMLWLAASALLPWTGVDQPSPAPSPPRGPVRAETTQEEEHLDQVAVSVQGNASFFLDGGS